MIGSLLAFVVVVVAVVLLFVQDSQLVKTSTLLVEMIGVFQYVSNSCNELSRINSIILREIVLY